MNNVALMAASILLLASCGGKATGPDTSTPAANPCMSRGGTDAANTHGDAARTNSEGGAASMDRRVETIEQLSSSIANEVRQLSMRDDDGAEPEATCKDIPLPDYCSDTCKVTDHICESSGRICTLAKELSGNTWAAEQCTKGTKSCRRARVHCCECKQAG